MNPRVGALLAAGVIASSPIAAEGADATLPRNLAATCASCHGTGGVSAGGFASLAGTKKEDLVAKLMEYKAGTRQGTVMPQLAKGYTDAQIDLIATWFAAQPAAR